MVASSGRHALRCSLKQLTAVYRVDHIQGEHPVNIQVAKSRTSIVLHEANVHYMTSNHDTDRHNNFTNNALKISFYEVLNTNEVSSLDVDDPI